VVSQPRLLIAATRSGDGKTTVATGIMAALRAGGLRVSGHKAGPDYIDPSYHAAATGRPGRNLDPWLAGEELIAPLFLHGARDADVAVVEGVMGLYDGAAGRGDFASTAHVGRLLDAPVVLVVGAAGAGRSVAATVRGFAGFDARVRLAGVVLNQVSSPRHEQILREALGDDGIQVLGALPAEPALHTPSRHLGLVPAAERVREVDGWLLRLRELIRDHLDLDRLTAIARGAPALAAKPWNPVSGPPAPDACSPAPDACSPAPDLGPPARIAVATGRAFTFGYAEHRELLEAAGAEVAEFDPTAAERLPAGTDALVVGGGFPQVYAEALAANSGLRAEVRRRIAGGMPVIAECAGLLWLGTGLDGRQQCGVLPASARMTGSLTLGYREAVAVTASPLLAAGTRVRAHEFHRTVSEPARGPSPAWQLSDGSRQGWANDALLASYLHLHWAGLPAAASRLVAAARASRKRPARSAGTASVGSAGTASAGSAGTASAGSAGTASAGSAAPTASAASAGTASAGSAAPTASAGTAGTAPA
jgi:cobyrinic acid a,c-diamide synthase